MAASRPSKQSLGHCVPSCIARNVGADLYKDSPAVMMVDFDFYDGPAYLTTTEGRKIFPILPATCDLLVGNETCARMQFGVRSI